MDVIFKNVSAISQTASMLATTLGPCGMDALLVDDRGDSMVANDGATILSHLPITHPANKLLFHLARAQEQHVGDGTTTAVLLVASMLQHAQLLLASGFHPSIIIQEFKRTLDVASQMILDISIRVPPLSMGLCEANAPAPMPTPHSPSAHEPASHEPPARHGASESSFRPMMQDSVRSSESTRNKDDNLLYQIARTTVSSKVLGRHREFFADLAVSVIQRTRSINMVKIIPRIGSSMMESRLLPGIQLNARNQPSQLYGIPLQHVHGSILVTSVDANTGKGTGQIIGTRVAYKTGQEYANWASSCTELELRRLSDMGNTIVSLGVNVAVFLAPISSIVTRVLVEHGVLPVAVSTIDELEHVALCTSCSVAALLSPDINVGRFQSVRVMPSYNYDSLDRVNIEGIGYGVSTVELVAPTDSLLAECERSFVNVMRAILAVVDEPLIVGGGGCVPIELSMRLKEHCDPTDSTYSTECRGAFCDALMVIPQTLALNGGYDAVQLIHMCNEHHRQGRTWHAVDLTRGCVSDMRELGVLEPSVIFREGLTHAMAIVEIVLKTDKNIVAKRRTEVIKD